MADVITSQALQHILGLWELFGNNLGNLISDAILELFRNNLGIIRIIWK